MNYKVGGSFTRLDTLKIKHLQINLCRCFLFGARMGPGFDYLFDFINIKIQKWSNTESIKLNSLIP
jgi:hypothetical protein